MSRWCPGCGGPIGRAELLTYASDGAIVHSQCSASYERLLVTDERAMVRAYVDEHAAKASRYATRNDIGDLARREWAAIARELRDLSAAIGRGEHLRAYARRIEKRGDNETTD